MQKLRKEVWQLRYWNLEAAVLIRGVFWNVMFECTSFDFVSRRFGEDITSVFSGMFLFESGFRPRVMPLWSGHYISQFFLVSLLDSGERTTIDMFLFTVR